MKEDAIALKNLEKALGYDFKDKALLAQAVTHRSYVNEHKNTTSGHNERLEFLGDAVLELVVTQALYNKFPESTEGDLTAYRSSLVNSDALAQASQDLNVGAYLKLSKGETKDTGRARTYILANTFEALVGAIYLDGGYEPVQALIKNVVLPKIDGVIENKSWIDSKSLFQAKAQEHTNLTPSYRTIKETGPDHDKHFTVGAYIGNEQIALGEGKSKQDAEQAAARKGLEAKGWV